MAGASDVLLKEWRLLNVVPDRRHKIRRSHRVPFSMGSPGSMLDLVEPLQPFQLVAVGQLRIRPDGSAGEGQLQPKQFEDSAPGPFLCGSQARLKLCHQAGFLGQERGGWHLLGTAPLPSSNRTSLQAERRSVALRHAGIPVGRPVADDRIRRERVAVGPFIRGTRPDSSGRLGIRQQSESQKSCCCGGSENDLRVEHGLLLYRSACRDPVLKHIMHVSRQRCTAGKGRIDA